MIISRFDDNNVVYILAITFFVRKKNCGYSFLLAEGRKKYIDTTVMELSTAATSRKHQRQRISPRPPKNLVLPDIQPRNGPLLRSTNHMISLYLILLSIHLLIFIQVSTAATPPSAAPLDSPLSKGSSSSSPADDPANVIAGSRAQPEPLHWDIPCFRNREQYDAEFAEYEREKAAGREDEYMGSGGGGAFVEGCHRERGACKRALFDDFVSEEEVDGLLAMARKGMQHTRADGGPTIFDVNSGFVMEGLRLRNIYRSHEQQMKEKRKKRKGKHYTSEEEEEEEEDEDTGGFFTQSQFTLYRDVVQRIHDPIVEEFALTSELYFSAPTFITRIVGDANWAPNSEHDKYWNPHVDKNNTAHYDYSGLLYLSNYGTDFEGGRFAFLDSEEDNPAFGHALSRSENLYIEPRRARLLIFSAGSSSYTLHTR